MAIKTYEVKCEGVVSAIQIVEAENIAEASEKARRAFAKRTRTDYQGVAVVEIHKPLTELELDLMRQKGL